MEGFNFVREINENVDEFVKNAIFMHKKKSSPLTVTFVADVFLVWI